MDRLESAKRSIQDEHLDMLIRLAYQREEEQLCQIHEENEDDILLTPERKAIAYAMFLEKMAAAEKERVKIVRIQKIRKHLPRLVNIAACLVIILCIAAPIAVAHVESLRVQVMRMLISIQKDHARLSLIEDEEASFSVPEEWKGEYYPSCIPEGFYIFDIDESSVSLTLKNDAGRYIHFAEKPEANNIGLDTEGAEFKTVMINGQEAALIAKNGLAKITWCEGDTYFIVTTNISVNDCIKVAENVKKVEK